MVLGLICNEAMSCLWPWTFQIYLFRPIISFVAFLISWPDTPPAKLQTEFDALPADAVVVGGCEPSWDEDDQLHGRGRVVQCSCKLARRMPWKVLSMLKTLFFAPAFIALDRHKSLSHLSTASLVFVRPAATVHTSRHSQRGGARSIRTCPQLKMGSELVSVGKLQPSCRYI